ncbi:MAG: phytanoyl-CoA dioxygenase family protein, partial [Hyphomicrobiaceae bacterium]
FYPHTNDDMLAVGLYLEDCALENGPLRVIPGSHKGPVFDHHHNGFFVGACDPAEFPDAAAQAVPLEGKAGSITIHHVRTTHASTENTGERERRLLLFSYAAVDAWPTYFQPDLEEFNGRILTGEATLSPRQTAVPVRMPLPPVPDADSIYDDQEAVAGRSFAA